MTAVQNAILILESNLYHFDCVGRNTGHGSARDPSGLSYQEMREITKKINNLSQTDRNCPGSHCRFLGLPYFRDIKGRCVVFQ